MEVDVGGGLSFGKGMDMVRDGDTLSEVSMGVPFEDRFEVFQPREDDFEVGRRIKGRTDREPKAGDDIGFQEM